MAPLRIQKHVTSETLYLPEIKPLIGRDVEITVREAQPATLGHGDLQALFELSGKIEVDAAAIEDLRRTSTL